MFNTIGEFDFDACGLSGIGLHNWNCWECSKCDVRLPVFRNPQEMIDVILRDYLLTLDKYDDEQIAFIRAALMTSYEELARELGTDVDTLTDASGGYRLSEEQIVILKALIASRLSINSFDQRDSIAADWYYGVFCLYESI